MELNESEDRNINAICIELNEYLMGCLFLIYLDTFFVYKRNQ